MVHSLVVVGIDDPSVPSVLMWHAYTPEWNVPRETSLRNVAALSSRVHSDFRLRSALDESFINSGRLTQSSSSVSGASQQQSPSSSSALQSQSQSQQSQSQQPPAYANVPEGVLRLPSDAGGCTVVWRLVPQFAALVCLALQPDESIATARHSLSVLSRVMCEQTSGASAAALGRGAAGSANKPFVALRRELFELRPDEAAVLIDNFLPSGELVIVTPSLSKHLRKEAEALIASK